MKTILKQIIVFTVLVLFTPVLFSQAPDTIWTKTFGDSIYVYEGNFIQQTADSGFITVGTIRTISGDDVDIFLMRFNSNGDSLWFKRYDRGNFAYGSSVKQTSDGGFIIIGTRRYELGSADYDIWLIKTNDIGNMLWTKTFGGDKRDNASSVQQTSVGGYIILGQTDSFAAGVWLIKTDLNGDTLWTKTLAGGSGYSVQQTADGGYIIAGKKGSDAWLIKTNVSGDTLWTKTFGGNYQASGKSVKQTMDGGYIIAGYKKVPKGMIPPIKYAYDVWLIKTNSYGDTLWTKTYGDSLGDIAYSVQQTTDGGYIITGSMAGDWLWEPVYLFVAKFDVNGNTMWTKIFGDNENQYRGYSIQQTFDNGYIIGGTSFIDYGNYVKRNIWLIKLAPDATSIIKTSQNEVKAYILYQNYPNPFNPSTTIEFDIPKSSEVTLKIFNILGEEVSTLVSDRLSTGLYSYEWDASNLASGIYLYRLEAGDYIETRKMVLMR